MIVLSKAQQQIAAKMRELKQNSGSHSPSIFTIAKQIPEIKIKIDACFLSNPYATDLFMQEVANLDAKNLRDILEFYPSQNGVIAERLSEILSVKKERIFISNGAIEAIQAILHNFVRDKIIVNIPTFSSYYEFAKSDTKVIFYELKKSENYALNSQDYVNFVKKHKAQSVVIINPNNPNGDYLPRENLCEILQNLREVENIIIDESFIHFAFEDAEFSPISYANLLDEFPNVILIKSMSKDFGIAGIRTGYAIMSEDKVQKLLKNGYLWNSNGLSEHFFRVYAEAEFRAKYEICRKNYIAQTQEFFAKLAKIKGLKIYPSKANFALIELLGGVKASDFVIKMLLEFGIYTRVCNDKIGLDGEFVRLASRKKSENEAILSAIKSLLSPDARERERVNAASKIDTYFIICAANKGRCDAAA